MIQQEGPHCPSRASCENITAVVAMLRSEPLFPRFAAIGISVLAGLLQRAAAAHDLNAQAQLADLVVSIITAREASVSFADTQLLCAAALRGLPGDLKCQGTMCNQSFGWSTLTV